MIILALLWDMSDFFHPQTCNLQQIDAASNDVIAWGNVSDQLPLEPQKALKIFSPYT